MALLFVYGSLKQGFPNAHHNQGRRLAGVYSTAMAYPLMLLRGQLPCLVWQPGVGLVVRGEVYEVSEAQLAHMDRFERVGEAGGYRRVTIALRPDEAGQPSDELHAQVYVQEPEVLAEPGDHLGPLAEYTPEHARHLRW
jgi:gamma-glutamylaminecyclotransferase